jgi:hypothetical protein
VNPEWEGRKGEVLAALAASVPGCGLAVLSIVALAMAAFGRYPMWPYEAITLAEAAG